jgi:1-acyl-sn-glycerol-3-phosphate acyltransferase
MKKNLAKLLFKISRWKLNVNVDVKLLKHSVVIAAPHTSNWDFPFTLAAFWLMGVDLKFFIKDSYTKGIAGSLFKWFGAIGVDREKKNNLVQHAVNLLNKNDELAIVIPAEGTRSYVEEWKSGFYHIATQANVDICLGYLDFKTKTAGIDKIIHPTGEIKHDLEIIEKYYLNYTGKNPELYNPVIFKRD